MLLIDIVHLAIIVQFSWHYMSNCGFGNTFIKNPSITVFAEPKYKPSLWQTGQKRGKDMRTVGQN